MRKLAFLLALLTALTFQNCKTTNKGLAGSSTKETAGKESSKPKPAVNFATSDQLMPLLAQAKEEDKLIFVDFYTTWCLPCRLMDEDVFTDQKLADFMNDKFINMKVNAERGNGVKLATIFQVRAYPTLLFLDAEGNVLQRKEGAAFQRELRSMAEKALSAN